MKNLIFNYLLVLAIGGIAAYLFTPVAEALALKAGAVDHPTARKVHVRPVPRLGGLAIYVSFLLAIAAQFVWQSVFPGEPLLNPSRSLIGIALGGTFILLLGLVDDFADLSPVVKFFGQIAAAAILVRFGVTIEFVGLPFSKGVFFLGSWGILLTLTWVVGLTNVVNFIDGLDGLAAGVCGIALIALSYAAYQTGRLEVALICVALAGSSLGFLRHNFHPARIFMGDSGSMFLGFILGAITVQGMMKSIALVALLVPFVILGVPIFDALLAVFRRFKEGRPVMQADRNHIHHRLLDRGFTHRQTVVIIYLWSILLSIAALTLMFATPTQKWLVFFGLAIPSLFLARYSGLFNWLRKG